MKTRTDCIGCLYDEPMDGNAHHRQDLGDGTYYRVVCTRGPIERELRRAADDSHFFDDGASSLTWAVFFDARSFHGLAEEDYRDVYSYAIEAASELGL